MKKQNKKIHSLLIAAALMITGLASQLPSEVIHADLVSASGGEATESIEEAYVTEELTEFRNEFSKTFEKSDGTCVSIISAIPVHYYDEKEKEWEEIDNTLLETTNEDGEKVLSNDNGNLEVEIPEEISEKNGITVRNENNKITISPIDVKKSEAEVTNNKKSKLPGNKNKLTSLKEDDLAEMGLSSSEIQYSNTYEDGSITYNLIGNTLKEYIELAEKPTEQKVYEYKIEAENLTAKLRENGSVVFKDKSDKKVFEIPEPFMFDSAEEATYSHNIKVELKTDKKEYILSYSPSEEWLNADDRVYPVFIDPTVKTSSNPNSVSDATAISAAPLDTSYSSHIDVGAARNGNVKIDTFIKFGFLPTLPPTYTIAKADLHLKTSDTITNIIYAYQVTSSWKDSSLNSSVAPKCSSTVLDRAIAPESIGWVDWDITEAVDSWYSNTSSNCGIKLSAPFALNNSTCFNSSECGVTADIPYMSIHYLTPMW